MSHSNFGAQLQIPGAFPFTMQQQQQMLAPPHSIIGNDASAHSSVPGALPFNAQQQMPAPPPIIRNDAAAHNGNVADMRWDFVASTVDPNDAGIQYLQGYSGKRNCHPKARKAKASLPWIEAKKMKNELSPEQVSRLIRGAPIEEAIPGYDSREDPDGILLNQQTRPSGLLALQEAIRLHHQFLETLPSSLAAFPDGKLTAERRLQYKQNLDNGEDDPGCTIEEYALDLAPGETLKSLWNVSWYRCFTASFIRAVEEDGWYRDLFLPETATDEASIVKCAKCMFQSLKKKENRRIKEANDLAKAALAKRLDRLRQRRGTKHQVRLDACSRSPTLNRYWGLLKAVGAEGCSDDETDTESTTTPLTRRRFDMKWRNPQYAALLHHLDRIGEQAKSNPLCHIGAVASKEQRPYIRATSGDFARKVLPRTILTGAPLQFYSPEFLADAKEHGLYAWLNVAQRYSHDLPNNL